MAWRSSQSSRNALRPRRSGASAWSTRRAFIDRRSRRAEASARAPSEAAAARPPARCAWASGGAPRRATSHQHQPRTRIASTMEHHPRPARHKPAAAAALRQSHNDFIHSVLAGSLEIVAVFDQRHAQCAHRGVFLQRIAVRHDDGAGHAVGARGPANALAMIAPRGADDFAGESAGLCQLLEIGQPAADLEGAHRRVVLVLDPAVGAQSFAQQRPAVLRRGLEFAVDDARASFDVGQGGQFHDEYRGTMPSGVCRTAPRRAGAASMRVGAKPRLR